MSESREYLEARIEALEQANENLVSALIDAMIYAEDVLLHPELLACFKKGVVERDVRQMRKLIESEGAAS